MTNIFFRVEQNAMEQTTSFNRIKVQNLLNDHNMNEQFDISIHPVTFPSIEIVHSASFSVTQENKKQNVWEVVHTNFFVPGTVPGSGDKISRKGWTKNEHVRFLLGIKMYGRGNWKIISKLLTGKSPKQVQSHAQKYFLRQEKENKNKRSIHDFNDTDLVDLLRDEKYRESIRIEEPDLFNLILQYEQGYSIQYSGEQNDKLVSDDLESSDNDEMREANDSPVESV